MIRKLFAFILITASALTAFDARAALNMSANGPSEAMIQNTLASIGEFVFAMEGVNGLGYTACEEQTGTPFIELSESEQEKVLFVNCISITTATEEAKTALDTLFPPLTKFQDIFVVVKYAGEFTVQ